MVRLLLVVFAGLALLVPAQAQARWLKAETARFIVIGDGSEADVRAYAGRLEDFDALLRFYHGMDLDEVPPRKLTVYLLEHRSDLRRLAPKVSEHTAGFYMASLGDVYGAAVRSLDRGQEDDDVLFHEYVHHFMLQAFPSTYPGWLVEGYAEYFMTAKISADRFEVGRFSTLREAALARGEKVAAKDLLTRRPTEMAAGSQRSGYYARAWLLTHFMLSDPARKAQLAAYVRALYAGTEPLAAWKAATGDDPAALDRRLDAYMTGVIRSAVFSRPARLPAAVAVTAMPASADALLLLNQRVMSGGADKDERPALLAQVREAAGAYPDDHFARTALARAEILYGDRAAGEAIAQALLAADGKDVEALRLMGQAELRAGTEGVLRDHLGKAGGWFASAYALDPNHYQTLYGFAQSRRADADYPTDNTIDVLRAAIAVAPQVGMMRITAAQALARRGRGDEAAILLRPLLNNPHGGALAERARTLMDRIAAGDKTDADG